jgi:GNAT superfamily N-acetyltransferase
MSAVAGNAGTSIGTLVSRRWREIDPLLPDPGPLPPGCGAEFTIAGAAGEPAAAATCEHSEAAPGSLDTAWGTERRYQLAPQITGPDIGGTLDRVLGQWRDHLAGLPGADSQDTAAVITWPSRDIDGVRALVGRGFAPLGVVAARLSGHHPGHAAGRSAPGEGGAPGAGNGPGRAGARIRRAGPADIGAVVRLGLEVIRYDAHFGNGGERPDTLGALRHEVDEMLAGPEPWIWLAERDGQAIGLVAAQRPELADWIAPLVRESPLAYVMLMLVAPGERAHGLGAELVARLHADIEAAGVPVTLLHYQQVNPLSVPFWSQQGYRPLWITWEARPARAIR